jgi:hypothetical protein
MNIYKRLIFQIEMRCLKFFLNFDFLLCEFSIIYLSELVK